ncbi:XRE family transcriptional regulator [Saccharothrix longispora]|uniref:helix-turn-helix domain-containing protein n=1 Tax=Saccharothrix longispora TaxID=33920 RepID=UPI0028FD66A3|nr:XRE family transcriptional regulator [Saccharothrix longispora]MDU0291402.1 XRE family transcriptional regulator [Saccharothrix longispora]
MSVDAKTLGGRIAEARSRAGLTQQQLASAVSLGRPALNKIENGLQRVSALQLARIADELRVRVEWFLDDAPPAILSHRNLQDPGAASPVIDAVTERIVRDVEFVLAEDSKLVLADVEPLARPTSNDEVEAMSGLARSSLGLDDREPLREIASAVASRGLLVFALRLGADSADAASVMLRKGGIALVNGDLQVGRRRLAVAHEFAHYLLADEYAVDWRVAESLDPESWEARLDRFARALLLPEPGVTELWRRCLDNGDDWRTVAVRVASTYRVDMSTLARRLVELAVIDRSTAQQVRAARTTRADIVELNLVVSDELVPPFLPREYEQAVLRLYRAETVSAARAVDLLLDTWDESSLPQLPELPEDAIWKFVG